MIEIRFTARALADIEIFIERLQVKFHELYSDIGIYNEKQLHDNYRDSLVLLYQEIR